MTLDEAIKHAEKVAEEQEKVAKEWHENQVRKCALIPFAEMDYTHENECKECASEHRQLAEWLKELKQLREQPRWIPCSEKLPKAEYGESDSVLVCFENGTQDVLYFDGSNWRYPTGESYISVNYKNGWHNKVLAWMPLPKPYEPQERENKE